MLIFSSFELNFACMSMTAALFAPAQARLLKRLFGSPQQWFHVNELIRLTGLGSASLQRELKRLDAAGLIVTEQIGNLKRMRANEASPVFEELASLVRKTLGTVPVLAEALAPFGARITLALVYGSVPRQADRADSDIDLMVVSDVLQVGDLLPALLTAESRLGRKISPTCYSVDEFERRRQDPTSFVSNVLQGPVQVLIGTIGESVAT